MDIKDYKKELENRELANNTITKYLRDVTDFLNFVGDQEVTQGKLISYKGQLLEKYKVSTVNNKITIINNYLTFKDKDISVKQERIQRNTTLDDVLTEKDFGRLVRMAENREKPRARITMLSIYHTGLRVSELQYLTVEAVKEKHIDINNKGKYRRVPITNTLSKELKRYIKDEGIKGGPIIVNKSGDPLSRSYIFKEMKWIGGQARLPLRKVYPHSIRHLFAKRYLGQKGNNMFTLADILGHSSLDTTRIYSTLSTSEQRESMDF